jgi:hypothetical protein
MSTYTDLTSSFNHKDLLTWQLMDELAENDNFIRSTFGAYRRPVLKWIGVSLVDVENNTGTLNETKFVFPDGEVRSVTEDTSSTNKYRRFDITATANFTSGTEDSGIRSGISEANNTWYAIYAVKSQINTANFVLAGDTTLPIQANFSTLNTRYGTNSWVYLGMIRNGDNNGSPADILNFVQAGNRTIFKNSNSGLNTVTMPGTFLAGTAGSATSTYTYAAGTGAANIPNHITIAIYGCGFAAVANFAIVKDAGAARTYAKELGTNGVVTFIEMVAAEGVNTSNGGGTSIAQDILLIGWLDPVLGIGSNPQL